MPGNEVAVAVALGVGVVEEDPVDVWLNAAVMHIARSTQRSVRANRAICAEKGGRERMNYSTARNEDAGAKDEEKKPTKSRGRHPFYARLVLPCTLDLS